MYHARKDGSECVSKYIGTHGEYGGRYKYQMDVPQTMIKVCSIGVKYCLHEYGSLAAIVDTCIEEVYMLQL